LQADPDVTRLKVMGLRAGLREHSFVPEISFHNHFNFVGSRK